MQTYVCVYLCTYVCMHVCVCHRCTLLAKDSRNAANRWSVDASWIPLQYRMSLGQCSRSRNTRTRTCCHHQKDFSLCCSMCNANVISHSTLYCCEGQFVMVTHVCNVVKCVCVCVRALYLCTWGYLHHWATYSSFRWHSNATFSLHCNVHCISIALLKAYCLSHESMGDLLTEQESRWERGGIMLVVIWECVLFVLWTLYIGTRTCVCACVCACRMLIV